MQRRSAGRRWAQSAAGMLVGLSLIAAPSTAQASVSSPVLAYQEESDSSSLITASANALQQVGVDGVNISSSGASVSTPDSSATAQLARAHALNKSAEFLVGNFSDSLGDFDEQAAYNLLSNAARRATVINSLVNAVKTQGWDGVAVDLESLQARDRDGLTAFVTGLRKALPTGKTISIAVTCFTNEADFEANGYNLWALGQQVTRIVLMAYDLHGFGDSGPGPIGPLAWQSSGLDVVLGEMNGQNDKVILGEAGYGYRWYTDWSSGHMDQVSDSQARSLAGSRATWDATSHEWHATLSDGSVLWWADAKSLADRQALVTDRGIHGLAVWDLGLSDPITHA